MAVTAPAAAQPQPPPQQQAETVDRSERIARASVVLRVGRAVRARGVVLGEDGRIVTALAALGRDTSFTVRYPNGRTDTATVVATDPLWGIALLQPRTGHWGAGLPLGLSVRRNTPARWVVGDEARSLGGVLRARRTFVARGGELLRDAWEFDPPPGPDAVGSGVASAAAELVAVVVPPDPQAPAGAATTTFGVPASAVRELLARAGDTARPWLGFVARELRPGQDAEAGSVAGLRVTQVTPGSPAETAGVRPGVLGDIVLAANERFIRAPADLAAVLDALHPGDTLALRVLRQGAVFDVPVQLGRFPAIGP